MPKWPEYKKKPYYDALTSFMATTHDMDTGKLLDSAVQPAVTAALAAESTVADAAALAVDDAAATFDYGPYVQADVEAALAADDTPAQAAAIAAEQVILGKDILEGGVILEEEIAGGVVDEENRATWAIFMEDGSLHPYTRGTFAPYFARTEEMETAVTGLSFGFVVPGEGDVEYRLWLEADEYGRPSEYALQCIADGIGQAITTEETVYPSDDWAHWGDSLTAAGWPAYMAPMTGRNHYNGGWGGQNHQQIAARQGGTPARVWISGNQIPATGSVTIDTITWSPLSNGSSRAGVLGGVSGMLTADSGGVHTFTRTVDGDVVDILPGERFVYDGSVANRNRIVTIWSGRNSFKWHSPVHIAASIQSMIDYLTPTVKRVIVMEIPPWVGEEHGTSGRATLDAANDYLATAFAPYWLPIASWLRTTDAAAVAGVTFTPDDLSDISNGLTPRSLRSDSGHLNTAGNQAVAARVYEEAQLRGWL